VIRDVTLEGCVPLFPAFGDVQIEGVSRIKISSMSKPRAYQAESSQPGEEDEAVSLV
jgi:hypothetical protein